MTGMQLARMTWQENREAVARCTAVLVPVGSVEQHGPHLPVDNDTFCAARLAELIAEEAGRQGIVVAVAPAIPLGVSGHHMAFPGTVTLRPRVFEEVVGDVGASLARHGWKRLLFVNGHGGNSHALASAIARLAEDYPGVLFLLHEWWNLIADRLGDILEVGLFHACEGETSFAMAVGQRVLGDRLQAELPRAKSRFLSFNMLEPSLKVGFPLPPMERITKSGVVGDPTKASAAKGEAMIHEAVERTMLLLKEMARDAG